MYYISQVGENDCGFACLKMLLAQINNNNEYLYIPNPKEDTQYSYQELIKLGKKHGLELQGVKLDDVNELKKNDNWPVIATLNIEGEKHAVVVKGIKFDKVQIYDPILGIKSLTFKKFIQEWDATLLIIKNNLPVAEDFDSYVFLTWKDHLPLVMLQIISSVILIIGMQLFNSSIQFVALIMIGIFIILQIFLKYNCICLMKKLDNIFLDYLTEENIQNQNLLKIFEEYKKHELSSVLGIVTSIATSIILMVLTLVSGAIDGIIIIFCLALSLIQIIFLNPIFEEKTYQIGILENKLNQNKILFNFQSQLDEIHKHSYKLGRNILISKWLAYFIIIISVILVMRITDNHSLAFLLFYGCLGIYLYREMCAALNIENVIKKKRQSKVILVNLLSKITK